MSLSIRNQLPGSVTGITAGEAMATVKVRLDGGQDITAAITLDAVKELGLAEGSAVRALVKSTEVSLATGTARGCPSATSSPERSTTSPRAAPWPPSRSASRVAN